MRTLLIAIATTAALAACSQGEEAKAPETTSVEAATPASREAVYAAASEGPEPFVRAIYARYVEGGPRDAPPAPGQDPMFSRTMNALIGADVRAANGEVPTLNYDPFCACQDQEDFTVTAMAVAQADPNAAEANVAFTNMGEPTNLTLKLVREGPNWKVDDIVDGDASLHDTLMAVAEAAG
ncbi:MAG: YbjP/YqhG family protein [Alphaproteobacteria bacterium]|nr:YbjP/YqhG family protein [Alphaproteobacteria bacterium]MBU2380268.1 YbjP/YqhG family protein [Alphaproteobacteria bacterium]